MKIFKLKYIVMLISASLLWSCQTEQAFTEPVATTKKVPLPDGIPSEADDQYEFAKSTYYHNNTVITDTLLIKQMLATANGLHIDETGYKKQIFVTEQETKAFEAATENTANRAAAAAYDGDNYLHYFFEIFKADVGSTRKVYTYITITGPRQYDVAGGFNINIFTKAKSSDPIIAGYGGPSGGTMQSYMFRNGTGDYNYYTDINVINTTRFKRRVKFISDGLQTVLRDLNSKQTLTVKSSSTYSGTSFEGINNFKVKRHESIKL